MPHFTVPIGPDGPVIELAVTVSRAWQGRVAASGNPVPSPTTVRALIDSGSDISVVHPDVLRTLGIRATGTIRVRRPSSGSGFYVALLSDVQLSIGGVIRGTTWIAAQVVGVAPATPTILALIGRDLLRHCTFFYNGPRSELTLSC